METLLETLEGIIEDGAKGMTPKERRASEEQFNTALDRSAAARRQRRETA